MAKILETKDQTILLDVKAIQDEDGGATLNGQPRIGCKKIGGVYIPLDQLPGYDPSKWRGTKEVYAVETDETDPTLKRLQLTDDVVSKIEAAKLKPANERDDKETKLAKAELVKDKPPKE